MGLTPLPSSPLCTAAHPRPALTARQNPYTPCSLHPTHLPCRPAVLPALSLLQAAGVKDILEWDKIEALSMACPAMPLCGLAIGEAERSLPDFNARLRAVLDRLGFAADEKFVVRATGEWGQYYCTAAVLHSCTAATVCGCGCARSH